MSKIVNECKMRSEFNSDIKNKNEKKEKKEKKEKNEKKMCNFDECNKRVKISIECSYCNFLYCRLHKMPEMHQCKEIKRCIEEAVAKNTDKLRKTKILKNKI